MYLFWNQILNFLIVFLRSIILELTFKCCFVINLSGLQWLKLGWIPKTAFDWLSWMGLPQAAHLEMVAFAVCAAARSFTHSFSDCVSSTCKKKMSFIKVNPTSHFSFNNLPYGIFSTVDNVSELCFFFSYIAIGWRERYFMHVTGWPREYRSDEIYHSSLCSPGRAGKEKEAVVWTYWIQIPATWNIRSEGMSGTIEV